MIKLLFSKYGLIAMGVLWALSLGIAVYKTHQITVQSYKVEQLENTITIVEKRNEIANNRPDLNAVIDGLRTDPNW